MKCPYQDIGCWHIDDVTHDCEASSSNDCRHLDDYNDPESKQKDRQPIESK